MKVIATERIPIKMWLGDIEDGALAQAKDLANLPFAFRHIAIMPDSHQGYGMPIGGVMATLGAVVPNAVGVDIGCGMCAVKTTLEEIDQDTTKIIMGQIRQAVPVGFNHHKEPRAWDGFDNAPDIPVIQQELNSARKQLGTLGGGNHFIEIQQGSDGFIWIMLHSGSRNFGYKTAKIYHELAKKWCERWFSNIPNTDLSFFPIETDEAKEYLEAMNYVLDFAAASRFEILDVITQIVKANVLGANFDEPINIHHNYAAWENHFGKNVLIHRKGATLAREGGIGIVPGSQGTSSYIVQGKGNPESFQSCSHGAGRKMGRKQAKRELSLEDEVAKMNALGVIHGIRGESDLDEAPGAYKDIDVVMENQADLVEVMVKLTPLAVIKG